ncbi:MAG: polysaccharide deacetylase family protein [Dehalococcoidia bacterium]
MQASLPDFSRLSRKVRDQRWRLAPWRLRAERAIIPRSGRPRLRSGGRVLSYHSTGTPSWGVNDVTPAAFFEQITAARRAGYRFCEVRDIASGAAGPKDLAITFDDGLRSILNVTPFLVQEAIPYAVFVVSDWPSSDAETFLTWKDLEGLLPGGATIGSHSVTHANFRDLHPGQREFELTESRRVIADTLGITPEMFAIPFGRARDWNADCTGLAQAAGYSAILGQSEMRTPVGTVGRSFLCRFDGPRQFQAVLEGRFDNWEEWF